MADGGGLFGSGGFFGGSGGSGGGGFGGMGPSGAFGAWPSCGCGSGCLLIVGGAIIMFSGLLRTMGM